MNKIRQNITALFLAIAMLVSGNFAFAVTHLHCTMEEAVHHTCEMECCIEKDCCEGEETPNSEPTSFASGDNCCEVHAEQASFQDYTIPLPVKTDAAKNVQLKQALSIFSEHIPGLTAAYHNNAVPQSIYLAVSNLRI